MSTRSFVGVMVGDKCRAVYVHFDGYLDGVGAELQEYTTQADAEDLISYGDRSTLFDGYYKDRGEDNVDPVEYDSFEDFVLDCNDSWVEWYYIFKDGVWYCGNTYKSNNLYKQLTPYAEAVEMWAARLESERV
jgi:hypothetical protein